MPLNDRPVAPGNVRAYRPWGPGGAGTRNTQAERQEAKGRVQQVGAGGGLGARQPDLHQLTGERTPARDLAGAASDRMTFSPSCSWTLLRHYTGGLSDRCTRSCSKAGTVP